jgi:hypothetical protein
LLRDQQAGERRILVKRDFFAAVPRAPYILGMAPFLYRCPNTGLSVQGWRADEVSPDEADSYEAVTCIACQQLHLVNPVTGEVLGEND